MNRTSPPLTPVMLVPVAILLLGGGSLAHAQGEQGAQGALEGGIEIPNGNGSYAANADGLAVRTGTGDCLRVGTFSEEGQVDACEGIEDIVAAPEPEPAPAPEPAVQEPIIDIATLGAEALFDTDSAELVPASEQALSELLAQLDAYEEITEIEVVGHTDSRGADAYNQGLSERRAESVRAFLQDAYPDLQISSRGEGESNPVATNSTPQGRQLNRRVEIRVTARSVRDA